MATFFNEKNATSSQLAFVKLLIESLTVDGAISAERLYESPFTSVSATGPDSIFSPAMVEQLFATIKVIRERAVA